MKTSRLACLLLSLCGVASSAPPNAEPERSYLVIEKTVSPDGRYAVAWTLPKGPSIDWEKFRSGERNSDYLPDFDKLGSEIKDNLIELKSGRKLAGVASGYWALPEGDHCAGLRFKPDDEFLEVAWSAQSNVVLVLHRVRSGSEGASLRAVQVEGGAAVGQLECDHDLAGPARAQLKKVHPQEYERSKDDLDLRFSDVKSFGGSKFSLRAIAKLESKYGNGIYRGSVIRFELRAGKDGKLSLHVLGFTELDLDEAS